MAEYKNISMEFEPVYDDDSHILILGSFPSAKSRENNFYYGHPQNRFWRVIAALTDEDVPQSIDSKRSLLLRHGIALWDVIESCDIIGSADSSIKNVVPADISAVLTKTAIKSVFVNGETAARLYKRFILPKTNLQAVKLPSTSPANARMDIEALINAWGVVRTEIENHLEK